MEIHTLIPILILIFISIQFDADQYHAQRWNGVSSVFEYAYLSIFALGARTHTDDTHENNGPYRRYHKNKYTQYHSTTQLAIKDMNS